VARELAKKTKGKGLSVLSGKALFEYDASLFVDDEEAGAEGVDLTQVGAGAALPVIGPSTAEQNRGWSG
jgi:hypothetical protein